MKTPHFARAAEPRLTRVPVTAGAARIAALYALFAGVWIFASDKLLIRFVAGLDAWRAWQTYKGWAFVAVTAGLLFLLVRRMLQGVQEAQMALARSEERFRAAVDAFPAEFVIYDAERRLEYVNAFGRRIARSAGSPEPLGKRDEEIFPPEHTTGFLPHLKCAYETRQPQQFEWTQPAALGARTMISNYVPLLDESGQVRQMLGVVHDITERKRAEEALRASEERLKLALAASRMGVWEWDLRTNATFWSPECFETLGSENFSGTIESFTSLLHPEDAARVMAAARMAIADRTVYAAEFRIIRPGGEVRWLSNLGRAHYDERGEPLRLVGTVLDVTERREAEEALRESEERFRTVIETAPEAIFIQTQSRFAYVNQAAMRLYGATSREQVIRQPVLDRCHPEFHDRVRERIRLLNEERRAVPAMEQVFVKLDGSLANVEVAAAPFTFQGHAGALVFARDITARRQAERALAESEQRFAVFMAHLPAAAFIKDESGRVLFANRYLEDLFGWRDWAGKSTADLLPPEMAQAMTKDDRRALAHGLIVTQEKVRDVHGAERTFQTYKFPITMEDRRLLLGGISFDITERKRAETALHELAGRVLRLQDEERRRIARELHDNTAQILAALNMNLALLEQAVPPEDIRIGRLLADCQNLTERSAQEIRTLAYLLHPPLLDQFGLARALRDYAAGFAQRSGLQVDLDLPEDLGRLPQTSELALFRVLQESLGNVHRHSGSPVVRVRLWHDAQTVHLEVRDEGRGLPPSALAGAFAGLGLLGMRERLEELGGRLELESGLPGVRVHAILRLREEP